MFLWAFFMLFDIFNLIQKFKVCYSTNEHLAQLPLKFFCMFFFLCIQDHALSFLAKHFTTSQMQLKISVHGKRTKNLQRMMLNDAHVLRIRLLAFVALFLLEYGRTACDVWQQSKKDNKRTERARSSSGGWYWWAELSLKC